MNNDILSVENLNLRFGGVHATRDVSITLSRGEIRAIIGPNGAGKSTLFNLITGFLKPETGTIRFNGRDITTLAPHERCRKGFARTFQTPNVASNATVLENIQLARVSINQELWRVFSSFRKLRVAEAKEILALVGLEKHVAMLACNLPFGEQKKLELAIALACDPEILLLDEPTAGVPLQERPPLMKLVQSIVRARGLTTILIEHDMDLVFAVADRITVLHHGAVIAEGRPPEVRQNREVQKIYLGEISEKEERIKPVTREIGETILSVRGLSAGYGTGMVLYDVSLSVAEGEVVCLLGRNGVGKTTTIKSIMGLVRPAAGQVEFLGRRLAGRSTDDICRMGIGYVPEDRRVFPDLTVMENLEVGRRERISREGELWTIDRVLELFALLKPLLRKRAKFLSGGEQRMLTIARALVGNPRMLLLDEPSEGLAPIIVQDLLEHIRVLQKSGLAILLAEQNLWFASKLSTRVYIIDKGQIQLNTTFAELEANPDLKQNYLAV